MTAKQLPGVYAPDGSLYITLTDGAGTLATTGGGLTIGTSTITSGTDGRVLYDNAGVLGEKTVTGTGSAVLATSPTLTTPALGVATGTSLAIGGATLGSNALAVTGTSAVGITTATSLALGGATIGSNALAVTGTSSFSNAITLTAGGIKVLQSGSTVNYPVDILNGSSYIAFASTASTAGLGLSWSGGANPTASVDTTLTRNAAGVVQFGTTAANASGSWLAANGSVATGTITTSQPFSITQTWNGAGVTFQGLTLNYTDTASSALSAALEIQYGGQTHVRFGKGTAGYTYLWMGQNITPSVSNSILQVNGSNTILSSNGTGGTANIAFGDSSANYFSIYGTPQVRMGSTVVFGFTSSTASSSPLDTILVRDAANTLAQRNGTTAQQFNLYNTYTDASNNEYVRLTWVGNAVYLQTQNNGTGSVRNINVIAGAQLNLGGGGGSQWSINSSGHLITVDNTYDIGASGATRPRNLYVAGIGTFGAGAAATPSVVVGNATTGLYSVSTTGLGLSVNGVLKLDWGITTTGILTAANSLTVNGAITVGSSNTLSWATGTGIFGNATSGAGTGALRVLFGGTSSQVNWGGDTSSFPALKRSSTVLQARLADDSAFAPMQGALRTSANATTGLTAGVLAATTNATIVITDASGQDYRIPCII